MMEKLITLKTLEVAGISSGTLMLNNEVHDPLICQDFRLCIQDISLELVIVNL